MYNFFTGIVEKPSYDWVPMVGPHLQLAVVVVVDVRVSQMLVHFGDVVLVDRLSKNLDELLVAHSEILFIVVGCEELLERLIAVYKINVLRTRCCHCDLVCAGYCFFWFRVTKRSVFICCCQTKKCQRERQQWSNLFYMRKNRGIDRKEKNFIIINN